MTTMTLRNLGNSQDDKLIVQAKTKPRYRLNDLLLQCDLSQPLTSDEQHWLEDAPAGDKVL